MALDFCGIPPKRETRIVKLKKQKKRGEGGGTLYHHGANASNVYLL